MSVPPDQLMNLIGKQQQGGQSPNADLTPPPGPMGQEPTPPMGSPMSTPEPKLGNQEGAKVNVSMAMDLLEQALPAFGSETDEGKAILGAIGQMSKIIGQKRQKTNELQSSEILQMLQNLPAAGGASPVSKAMAQAPMIPGLTPGGSQGGAPQGMPPMPPGGTPPTA